MKKIIGSVILCLILITNAQAFDKSLALKTDVHLLSKGEESTGICNGVVLQNTTSYATVLTAKHCTEKRDEFWVENNRAYLIKESKDYDLAFLFVPNHLYKKEGIKIAKEAKINTPVYYIGEVAGLKINEYGRILYHNFLNSTSGTTLHIIRGCSGGGIINEDNELVGIVVTGYFLTSPKAIISNMQNLTSINYFLLIEVGGWNGRY